MKPSFDLALQLFRELIADTSGSELTRQTAKALLLANSR